MPEHLIQMDEQDWEFAQKAVAIVIAKENRIPPFILRREELLKKDIFLSIPLTSIRHDIFVIPAENGKPGDYNIGVTAALQAYFPKQYVLGATSFEDKIDNVSPTEEINRKKINKIQEKGYLGRGSFGRVEIIKWQDGSINAIKIQEKLKDSSETEVKNETKILQTLGRLKAYFTEKDVSKGLEKRNLSYIIQQLHPGISLRNYFTGMSVSGKLMSTREKAHIALMAAKAIQELHTEDIVHADIKPENFMISFDGSSIIVTAIDFGLSYVLKEKEDAVKKIAGTWGYIPPDIGITGISKNTDIYSLGIMLREDLKLDDPTLNVLIKRMTLATDRIIKINDIIYFLEAFIVNKEEKQDALSIATEKEPAQITPTPAIKKRTTVLGGVDDAFVKKHSAEYIKKGKKISDDDDIDKLLIETPSLTSRMKK